MFLYSLQVALTQKKEYRYIGNRMPGLSLQRNDKPGGRGRIPPTDRKDSSLIKGDYFLLSDNLLLMGTTLIFG